MNADPMLIKVVGWWTTVRKHSHSRHQAKFLVTSKAIKIKKKENTK